MTRSLVHTVAGLALLAGALASPLHAQDGAGIAVGSKAPTAAVETLDGRAADLGTMIGSVPTVMEFWATWCPLCRKLEPQLQALQTEYGSRVRFISVGVSQNQTPERQQTYVTDRKLGGTFVFDRTGAATSAYKVPHTSYVVIVDPKGMVAYTGVGAEQDVSAALKRVMGTAPRP